MEFYWIIVTFIGFLIYPMKVFDPSDSIYPKFTVRFGEKNVFLFARLHQTSYCHRNFKDGYKCNHCISFVLLYYWALLQSASSDEPSICLLKSVSMNNYIRSCIKFKNHLDGRKYSIIHFEELCLPCTLLSGDFSSKLADDECDYESFDNHWRKWH